MECTNPYHYNLAHLWSMNSEMRAENENINQSTVSTFNKLL